MCNAKCLFSDLGYCTNNHTLINFSVGIQCLQCLYRFISCGTIEEKIYRRQVFKHSVNLQTMQKDDKNLFRFVL